MTLTRRFVAPGEVDHERWWLLVAACLVGLVLVAQGRPALAFPLCPLKALSGLPCAACGSLRALDALVHGDVARAIRMNPLATLGLVTLFAWLAHAAMAMALGWPRWRIASGDSDLLPLRWATALSVALTWLYLIVDGR